MRKGFIVTGTDTGIGKTVFSAALTSALGASYWKPVQAGLEGNSDSETVLRLAGLPARKILSEAYRLALPASPHIAAAREGHVIDASKLRIPQCSEPLIIEGAGGLLVPLSLELLQIDVFASWGWPVILCARTALGTINHTLLSLEALAARAMRVHGIAFIGEAEEEVEQTIVKLGKVRHLGRLPFISPINAKTLLKAFHDNFRVADFMSE